MHEELYEHICYTRGPWASLHTSEVIPSKRCMLEQNFHKTMVFFGSEKKLRNELLKFII